MLKNFTCIICPNGCEISADFVINDHHDPVIHSLSGALCPQGGTYVREEITNPQRNIATSIVVNGGILPLTSVRLSKPIPKNKIFDVMAEIKKCSLIAPVITGHVVIHNILGLGSDVIVTKDVLEKK